MSGCVTLDRRWFIVAPGNKGIVYTLPGSSATEAWRNLTNDPNWGEQGRKYLHRKGYRAKLCEIFTDAEIKP